MKLISISEDKMVVSSGGLGARSCSCSGSLCTLQVCINIQGLLEMCFLRVGEQDRLQLEIG